MNEQDAATVEPIAVVGMACRYPDADGPAQLWDSVLDRRRAFRRLPKERFDLDDYFDRDRDAVDRTYSAHAAVLDGWEFDRARFRVPGAVYRAADPAHWLALETAARALDDARLPTGDGVDRDRAAVVVGNTLTGEVTRARTLRLRWPYTRKVLAAAMAESGVPPRQRQAALDRAAELYRDPFPASDDETLAGGLSSTIAGRICNHFDLGGGGHTVDGACASSLLAVITACRALVDGSVDFALAGGVDLSLDPFELVGFAKTGALAADRMRVYDENSGGFWPGEGCGMVALMRTRDARAAGLPVRAEIPGWGVSSDGRGGITRPEIRGQLLALRRAYSSAGLDPAEVLLHEGHGTGTAVGDEVELEALARLRHSARTAAALGSVKANIGHTKAAAGVASLIKAVRGVETGVLPPTTGCEHPHRRLREAADVLRVPEQPESWPRGPRVAGVSAMGFGGINTHVVVRAAASATVPPVVAAPRPPVPRTEVVALSAGDTAALRVLVRRVAELAPRLSEAQLHDLACHFGSTEQGPTRAALVAATPEELGKRAHSALALLDDLPRARLRSCDGVYVGDDVPGRVSVLIPGQGAPAPSPGGALARYWPRVCLPPASGEDGAGTAGAQPRIHRASVEALRWLEHLGVRPVAAVGHSLGEFAALVWAGCLSAEEAARLVAERGRVMARDGVANTGMVSVGTDEAGARALCANTGLVVAAFNGPRSHVLAGALSEVRAVADRAAAHGTPAKVLPVSHAFHSPAVAGCAQAFRAPLHAATFHAPRRRMVSTVTGRGLEATDDVADLLGRQIIEPVRFREATDEIAAETDLFCEAGPGHTLTTLLAESSPVPVVGVDAGGDRDRPLGETVAALFAARAVPDLSPIFTGRPARSFDPWRDPVFVTNPCSLAPEMPSEEHETPAPIAEPDASAEQVLPPPDPVAGQGTRDVATVTRSMLAEATELDPDVIETGTRLLADLHLTSLRVTQLVAEIADALGRRRPAAPLNLSQVTVTELIDVVEALPVAAGTAAETVPAGLRSWIRCFAERHRPLPAEELASAEPGDWPAHVHTGGELSAVAAEMFGRHGSPLVYVPDPASTEGVDTVLRAARSALEAGGLVAVTHGSELTGFLRSLRHEHPELGITVLRVPPTVEGLRAAEQHARVEPGCWREHVLTDEVAEPVEEVLELDHGGELPLGNGDVLLVTGGGKGIGHECAAAFARATGVRLALIGRSDPGSDEQLVENLRRLREAGLAVAYERADVADGEQVRVAVGRLRERLGEVSGVLHASGRNEPIGFTGLDATRIHEHLAPKVTGLRHVMDALDPLEPRLVVSFGSVIGTWGLAGESHYALANAALRDEMRRLAATMPTCRVLNVDWSVWSEAGMGERLGALDALTRLDVAPIPVDEGVDTFLRLLATRDTPVSVAVHGRLGTLAGTATDANTGLEGRFLERVPVHYPGVELVAEATVGLDSDPHVAEHRIDGTAVLPGVVAVEAMSQAASRLAGKPLRAATDIRLDRPIIVPETGTRELRMCVLRRADSVEAVVRTDETDFRTDHARAVFTLTAAEPTRVEPPAEPSVTDEELTLGADQLYGSVYFHTGRFRRVRELTAEGARRCRARILAKDTPHWFATEPLLGDPTVNDATLHALQACVPHRRVLPVSCERLTVVPGDPSELWIRASERHAAGGSYVWDVVACDGEGAVVIDWQGLTLTDVGPLPRTEPWPEPLLAVYLERTSTALGLDPRLRVRVHRTKSRSGAEDSCSLDRAAGTVLAVEGPESARCAVEQVEQDAERHPLGADRVLVDQLALPCPEPFAVRATRVATVRRCLPEADSSEDPLVLEGVHDGGLILFRSGDAVIVSAVVFVLGLADPVSVAILTRKP